MGQIIKKVFSADGTSIAYAKHGKGPCIVKTATYLSHLQHDWNNPVWGPLLSGLSKFNTLIMYDERGSGLSDWYTNDYGWERWIEDLKAVVDAENIDKFVLYGQSQGSTVATAFAARYPERVEKLIILGGYARGWLHRDLSDDEKLEEQLLLNMIKIGWGKDNPAFRNFFCSQIMPDAGIERINAFNELMKISADPEIASLLEAEMHLTNVVEEAKNVKCPTLILHPYEDASVPFKEGRLLSNLIPDARFVRLESNNHILQDNEQAWDSFWNEVYGFIGVKENYSKISVGTKDKVQRTLKTILFTDIVNSTKLALTLGDKQWIDLLEHHSAIAHRLGNHYNSEMVKDTGDGFLMLFDSPSKALQYAKDLIQELNTISINIRCGIHAGEIELITGECRGINIHLASRILSQAGANEIWVSEVVKELILGSGDLFEEKGVFNLKGISESKNLFKLL